MPELNWHEITSAEKNAAGYDIVIDVTPDQMPDMAAEWNGVLIRTMKPGFSWMARRSGKKDFWVEMGFADTGEEAIKAAMDTVNRQLAKSKLQL